MGSAIGYIPSQANGLFQQEMYDGSTEPLDSSIDDSIDADSALAWFSEYAAMADGRAHRCPAI